MWFAKQNNVSSSRVARKRKKEEKKQTNKKKEKEEGNVQIKKYNEYKNQEALGRGGK